MAHPTPSQGLFSGAHQHVIRPFGEGRILPAPQQVAGAWELCFMGGQVWLPHERAPQGGDGVAFRAYDS